MGLPGDSDIFQLQLSSFHSLELVRLPVSRKYRVIFVERTGVQRRAFVEISFDQARRLAKFLANVDSGIHEIDDGRLPTQPGDSYPSEFPQEMQEGRRSRKATMITEPMEKIDLTEDELNHPDRPTLDDL